MSTTVEQARKLNDTALTIDMHTHGLSIVPRWLRTLGAKTIDMQSEPLSQLPKGKVNLAVVTAVGDALLGTAWRLRSPWNGVKAQLELARAEASAAGIAVVETVEQIEAGDTATVMLGVEGADVVGAQPDRLIDLHRMGVRVLGLVHYADNALGTIGTSVTGSRGSRAVRAGRYSSGLTALGKEVVAEANRLGMLIDLAHADAATTLAVCDQTSAPVVSSHTGALAVHEFPRYISDEEARAISATGGLIGLWPMGFRGVGMRDLDEFARHASHLAELVGPEHLCIGTDMNGIPRYVPGFDGPTGFPSLIDALLRTGFDASGAAGVLGGNALRVLKEALPGPSASGRTS
ncbi:MULTISPECIES: dipeptidase [Mycobacteroides]|jgi:microsomal dipeptidase-like Zn-dependent dipeptidase|uniref:dipeptidase n=1 Tax=Mycobacteroides TaxID=670516 RepID=UPI0007124FDC|nr:MULTISPECIES: membrane dipeptidase [Mycobacteroides]KRQ22841.1 dipeptidase [Mycobacteroides sp. H072]KRQ40432.1 dipeptidase [Mycobacteroides sp. H002]KRQ47691.1 dipeptidase [Mycobacteroides sp. H054]KRQ70951.1 dipeptidase [Mycobacteroides sp. H001]MBF9349164.1 dipeptidase [Mycobacteroides chelonae]